MLSKKSKAVAGRRSAEEEFELACKIRVSGDIDARNTLVMANEGLVHMIVRRMLRPYLRYEDLLQEGILGLIRATETFEPDRQIRFATYGAFWIRAKIQRYIQSMRFVSTGSEVLLWETETPERQALRTEQVYAVRDILGNIVRELKNPHLQAIVDRRILAEEPESLEKLGEHLHMSRESCRLLESKMLKLAHEQLANWRS